MSTDARGRGTPVRTSVVAGGKARIAGGREGRRAASEVRTAGATWRTSSRWPVVLGIRGIVVTLGIAGIEDTDRPVYVAVLSRRAPDVVSACACPAAPSSQPVTAMPAVMSVIISRRLVTGRVRAPGQHVTAKATLRVHDRPETTRSPWH